MIEVNLSPNQTQQDFTKIGPINLSMINPVFLVIGIVIFTFTEGQVEDFFQSDIDKLNSEYNITKKKLSTLRNELRSYDSIKKQVEELNKQEKNLASKIGIVKKIVDKRQNPFRVLKYVAEKTPKDVWIIELELDDKNLKIKGFSKTWASIGSFIEELKQSIHFDGAINYTKPPDMKPEFKGNRVETFEITTVVTNFRGV
jgi:hypothetical protein